MKVSWATVSNGGINRHTLRILVIVVEWRGMDFLSVDDGVPAALLAVPDIVVDVCVQVPNRQDEFLFGVDIFQVEMYDVRIAGARDDAIEAPGVAGLPNGISGT